MKNCKTCKHWAVSEPGETVFRDSQTGLRVYVGERVDWLGDDDTARFTGDDALRRCVCPGITFRETPKEDGAMVLDGSEYHAELLTGPFFGCTLHEEGK